MGEGPAKKKRRKAKADGEGEGAAAEEAGGGSGAGSVAEVLAKALPGSPEAAGQQDGDGAGLSARFSRLFGGGGGLFSGGAEAAQSSRTPSASSAAAPRRGSGTASSIDAAEAAVLRKRTRSSEPASSSTAGSEGKTKAEGKAEAADGERGIKDRSAGRPSIRPTRTGPLTPEEKKERETRLVFIGNVPLDWDEKRLRRALKDAVGDKYTGGMRPIWFRSEPLKVKWGNKKWKDGHKLKDYADGVSDAKYGYAELDSPDAVRIVSKAIHNYKADDNHILRGDGVGEASTLQNFDRKRSVFVGNLPASTSEADLRKALGPAGTIDAVRVVRDKEAKACKGIAFVRFVHRGSVKLAFDLNDPEVKGRPLRISKVTDQSEEGKVKAHREWELTGAARRIMMREQKKQRSKLNKAIAKRKEANATMGKRKKGPTTKAKRNKAAVKTKNKLGKKKSR